MRGVILVWLCGLVAGCGGGGGTDLLDGGGVDAGAPDAGPVLAQVALEQGVIEGTVDEDSVAEFLGIPYAAPPLGEMRFRPPGPAPSWDGVRDGTDPGPACPMVSLTSGEADSGDEDCLLLHLWTPALDTDAPRPVMVLAHGGAYGSGSGKSDFFHGAILARDTGNIVVSINYRLGALGALAHPALTAEQGTSGNWHVRDHQAALGWVQDNAAAFGGDPDRVMLFGESGGGNIACVHLGVPSSGGLFHSAASQSGACGARLREFADAEAQGSEMASTLGCTGSDEEILSCLRAAPVADLLALEPSFEVTGGVLYRNPALPWGPTVDGELIEEDPIDAIRAGRAHDVPIIAGSNADEGSLFHRFVEGGEVDSAEQVEEALTNGYGADGAAIWLAANPVSGFESPNEAMVQATGDGLFTCMTRRHTRELADAGYEVYLYHLTRAPNRVLVPNAGVFHASDLVWLMGNQVAGFGRVSPDEELADAMRGYWGRLAATGDPNADGSVGWPRYDSSADELLRLDLPITVESGVRDARCDVWDEVYDASDLFF